ncbi:MAG: FkbM family methyltransferase [Nocardioides sp.]
MLRSSLFRAFSAVFSRLYGTRVAKAIWLVPGSRRLYGFLIGRLRPDEVTVRGHLMRLDPLDSLLLSVNGTYEEAELNLFRDCLRAGDTVLDVGGHIGLYALEASEAVGRQGRVVSFEPSSDNFAILEHNVATNGCANVTLVRAAVADAEGELTLVLSRENSGDHQLAGQDETDAATERIRSVTIDGYCAEAGISGVAVIKMDIQGAEPVALAGAKQTIATTGDLILFTEVSPAHLATRGGADAYLRSLADAGFDLWQLDDAGVTPRTVADLEHLTIGSDTDHADLVCAKGPGARARLEDAISRQERS